MSALLAVHVQHNYPAMLHVVVPAHRAADNVLTLQGYQSIQPFQNRLQQRLFCRNPLQNNWHPFFEIHHSGEPWTTDVAPQKLRSVYAARQQ